MLFCFLVVIQMYEKSDLVVKFFTKKNKKNGKKMN